MKTIVCLCALLTLALLTGCGGSSYTPSNPGSAAMATSDVIRVDLLTQSFHAAGKNPAELEAEITDAYKSQKIYTNPVINVVAEERYVNVGGDVRGPSNIVWRPDSTVMSTINACGGFTDYADRHAVRIIRGKERFQVDCVRAASDPGADPAVYPGDQIYVPRSLL